ncbi:E1 ubiquitin-activating protein uba2 [Perkinsus chesapeaki]|uniref:E1 ubiquitin-activating protein uba2 n=1 Tax=Perkinsus chesapeaki TaxID=330153 RepID=A0A7J6LIC6_PERCH|nr:E1 ubiquitin-activating protein uba2 [Perkinsus chesapeaki]
MAATAVTSEDQLRGVPPSMIAYLGEEEAIRVANARLLVVGAGGIGCELLKDLSMMGVRNITTIDLDTIDVSNLNRQFLFRRHHVNRPKAEVASEAAMAFNKEVKIDGKLGNVKEPQYSSTFFSSFDVVLNALDNVDARRHVNRLCLATKRPMIEAGTTGFTGQCTVIYPQQSECYECTSKAAPKVYPVCTIRSTPSTPVHCIQWAKLLFELMFGIEDDNSVLADLKEPLKKLRSSDNGKVENDDEIRREAIGIFNHLFCNDIKSQLKLTNLWVDGKRQAPVPVSYEEALTMGSTDGKGVQAVWSVATQAKLFVDTVSRVFSERRDEIGTMAFSKDDKLAVDFVCAAANMRMKNYHIPLQSRWSVESVAGAIVPAVATTNCIVAGLQCTDLLGILREILRCEKDKSHGFSLKESGATNVWIKYPDPAGKSILVPDAFLPPNPNCYVCQSSWVTVTLNDLQKWSVQDFVAKVLKKELGASAPLLVFQGNVIYETIDEDEADDDEDEGLHPEWSLAQWDIEPGSLVDATDDMQAWSTQMVILEDKSMSEEEHPELFVISRGQQASMPEKRLATDGSVEAPAKRRKPNDEKEEVTEDAWRMTTLNKLGIQGIRSFSSERIEAIEFEKPVTLIVGHNGAGKTTVIECLKMATTGVLPPNCDKGHGFVFDPNVAGVPEVKGQIKLMFRSAAGRQVVMSRIFQLTNQRNRAGVLKTTFKQLESLIKVKGENGAPTQTITKKCADMDVLIPQLMGVPKAVLENVIFCHQEDSNWPLSDKAALKKKFDDIFGSARYTKALESIEKCRKELMAETKDKKHLLEMLGKDYEGARSLKAQLENLSIEEGRLCDEVENMNGNIDNAEAELKEALEEDSKTRGAQMKLAEKKGKFNA